MHRQNYAQMRSGSDGVPSHDPLTPQTLTAPIARAVLLSGLSRSAIYRAAAEGKITLLKVGRSTLVDMASVRSFLANLPRADIGRRPQTS